MRRIVVVIAGSAQVLVATGAIPPDRPDVFVRQHHLRGRANLPGALIRAAGAAMK
jgi:hypothetical protein